MTPKDIRFPVSLAWAGGRLVRASVEGKPTLELATPPEFKGTDPDVWSPEDFLVAAAASCFAVTFLAVAERRGVAVEELAVEGVGRMGVRDGALGFVGIDLVASVLTQPGQEPDAAAAAVAAERGCFVSNALAVPVLLDARVRAAAPVG